MFNKDEILEEVLDIVFFILLIMLFLVFDIIKEDVFFIEGEIFIGVFSGWILFEVFLKLFFFLMVFKSFVGFFENKMISLFRISVKRLNIYFCCGVVLLYRGCYMVVWRYEIIFLSGKDYSLWISVMEFGDVNWIVIWVFDEVLFEFYEWWIF